MSSPMHPNDALAYLGNNSHPQWAISNYPDENPGQECWKLLLSCESDGYWNQVFDKSFLRLDLVVKAMYENGLPVSTIPMEINGGQS